MHRSEELCWAPKVNQNTDWETCPSEVVFTSNINTNRFVISFFFNMTFLIQVWWSLFHHHISAAVPFLLRTLSICQYNTCLTLRDCERLRNLLIRRGGTKNHQPSINSKEIKRERNPPDCIMKLIHLNSLKGWLWHISHYLCLVNTPCVVNKSISFFA